MVNQVTEQGLVLPVYRVVGFRFELIVFVKRQLLTYQLFNLTKVFAIGSQVYTFCFAVIVFAGYHFIQHL